MKYTLRKFSSGFTLLELLVVMAVIGMMGSVIYIGINPQGQINKANDAKRKSDIAAIQSALEQFRFDNGSYPLTSQFDSAGCSGSLNAGGITYLQRVPCDPRTRTAYDYGRNDTTGNYCLRACLQNTSDSQRDSTLYGSDNYNVHSCTGLVNCPSGTYSYTVFSQ
jgi:general secretion pathway protein G